VKTQNLKRHKDRLARVNDQLCYHFFAAEQAKPAIHELIASKPDDLVSQSFPENSFSPRINIRNKFLPQFQQFATETLGGIALVSAVECLLSYSDEIQSLRAALIPSAADAIEHEKAEEQLSLKLTAWGSAPSIALTMSLAYLRLRRNHIAHVNQEPHPSLRSVTKNYGKLLSTYWAQQPTKLPGISFSSLVFSAGTEQEAFSLLNLCRVVMEKYDALVCSTLPQPRVEAFALQNFLGTNKDLRGRPLADRYRKFAAYFHDNFGSPLAMTTNEFDRAWVNF